MKPNTEVADLFAGGGGTSTGVAQTCEALFGRKPSLLAVNHWDIAVKTHQRNYPWARHLCTGLDAVNPTDEIPGGRLNLLAASPECTDHSNARGGKPCNNQRRSSAWLVLKWLQELYVEGVMIENVQEFEDWGPLGANGRPLKSMRGQLFDQFIASIKALGYNVDWRVLNSANYGAATARERLYILARRGKNKRIIWPDPTHAPLADIQSEMFEQKARWKPARDIIDWSLPSQSIFNRKRPLVPNTMERIAAGLRKFGGKAADPFLVVLRNHMGARSLNEPISTISAGGTHVGLCQPFIVPHFGERAGQIPRCHSIDGPLPTVTSHGAGALVQPFVLSMEHSKNRHQGLNSIAQPMPTITTVDAWGVVEPFLVEYRGSHTGRDDGNRRVKPVTDPLPTQTTENRFGLLEPLIVSYYGTQNVSTVDQPLPTVTTKDRFGLVQFGEGLYLDIHFRMLTWRELARAMGFPEWYEFEGNRGEKVRMIGNAVEVHTASALARSALAA